MRGVLPEETVELGKINENSIKFKIMKIAEKLLVKKAAIVIVVSEKFKNYIAKTYNIKNIYTVYNSANFIDYEVQSYKNIEQVRFIYSGSLREWHLPDVTIKYFISLYKKYGNKIHLLFCTSDVEAAQILFHKHGLACEAYTLQSVPFDMMPYIYRQAHIAFNFIKPTFAKSVCFPVKFSEYIAANLFVIANKGVGDLSEIINKHGCGIAFDDLLDYDNNLIGIEHVINAMLCGGFKPYNRSDINYLNWESSIKTLYSIYTDLIY